MPGLTPLDPGLSPVFTATPPPAGSSIFGAIPTWTSSDPTNAPVTVDPTGLIGTVALSSAIPVGEVVTLTVAASFTDGFGNAQSITGTVSFTIGAPPPAAASGFSIVQTA